MGESLDERIVGEAVPDGEVDRGFDERGGEEVDPIPVEIPLPGVEVAVVVSSCSSPFKASNLFWSFGE